jgi:hypothetical protein
MSHKNIEQFLMAIDDQWNGGVIETPLRVIGSTALMLQAEYQRGTKDGDVLGVDPVTGPVRERLLALAGKGSRIHNVYQIYIDIVRPGLLFLPRPARYHDLPELNGKLRNFRVSVLDVVDVVVSKLIRFNSNDQDDITAMAELDLLDPVMLVTRFRTALEWFLLDARADDLPRYVKNLHRIERDLLQVAPSCIVLPDWLSSE